MTASAWCEPVAELSPEARDLHRVIVALIDELHCIDSCNQRAEICTDRELRGLLEHRREQAKDQATQLVGWLRIRDPAFFPVGQGLFGHRKPAADK